MEAKLIDGRIELSENPTATGGFIDIHYTLNGEAAVGRMEIRENLSSYDLPEGVTPEMVDALAIAGDGEQNNLSQDVVDAALQQEAPAGEQKSVEMQEGMEASTENGTV